MHKGHTQWSGIFHEAGAISGGPTAAVTGADALRGKATSKAKVALNKEAPK